MQSIALLLSLAGAASAQIVNGVSMVPISAASTTAAYDSSSAAATAAYDSSAASSSANGYYGSASSSAQAYSAAATGYSAASTTSAAPASYTTPPPSTSTDMSYSSFMSGGYSSMNCGYGYSKASDGSCTSMSWVRDFLELWISLGVGAHEGRFCSIKLRGVMRRSSSTIREFRCLILLNSEGCFLSCVWRDYTPQLRSSHEAS